MSVVRVHLKHPTIFLAFHRPHTLHLSACACTRPLACSPRTGRVWARVAQRPPRRPRSHRLALLRLHRGHGQQLTGGHCLGEIAFAVTRDETTKDLERVPAWEHSTAFVRALSATTSHTPVQKNFRNDAPVAKSPRGLFAPGADGALDLSSGNIGYASRREQNPPSQLQKTPKASIA